MIAAPASADTGTDLYRRRIASAANDDERGALMAEVWTPTPWMESVFTGYGDSERRREMREWCRERFGEEAFIIAGKPGAWQFGLATIYGWNWIGFATEAQMA